MEEQKLQCYIKSMKSDAAKTAESIIPFGKWIGKSIVIIGGAMLLGVSILYAMFELLPIALEYLSNITLPYITDLQWTQYNVYLIAMICIDFILILMIKPEEGNGLGEAPMDVGPSLGVIFGVFIVNAACTLMSRSSMDEEFASWSYMIGETIINMVLMVIGIFLVRAYIRCKHPKKSVVSSDDEN